MTWTDWVLMLRYLSSTKERDETKGSENLKVRRQWDDPEFIRSRLKDLCGFFRVLFNTQISQIAEKFGVILK
jgi:hypothetical protein